MTKSPTFRRRSMKGLHRSLVGPARFGAAILASLAICVWPVWAGTCCCRASAASQIASDLPPCCQATHSDAQASVSDPACCSLAHVECSTCDGVKHECPCEVRDQNLDRWVGTRVLPDEAPELGQDSVGLTGQADFELPSLVPPSFLLAYDDQPFSLSAIDRCALLCRWLN
ncbi:hypothetical protein Pla100_46810 [Neorhodopirellula pilleata]|uniref:Uncharacterized protein n=1 Tax=Neorhodopirellula pilleata TaxID=2714738 RepID=A0A5C5ZYM5_9BACT|nr:hypothetical protein Pla100_46810 [Neorhodopirellula pilleata]